MASIGAASVAQALAHGVEFLLAQQGRDGLWRDFETLAGQASDWPTGFVGAQLVGAGVHGTPITGPPKRCCGVSTAMAVGAITITFRATPIRPRAV